MIKNTRILYDKIWHTIIITRKIKIINLKQMDNLLFYD